MRNGIFFVYLLLGTLLCSCTTTKTVTKEIPVTVEKVTRDTLLQTRWRVDTVMERDSIVVTQQGTDRWRTKYVLRVRVDTIFKSRVDTVPKVVTVTKETTMEVPRRLRWWEVALQWLGGLSLVGGMLCIMLCLKGR
ncbi:MAG: hypothetical protein MSS96_11495 [Bacteroidales bacterium]|nr:hypothetical protein [Bacteroidales bacterium]